MEKHHPRSLELPATAWIDQPWRAGAGSIGLHVELTWDVLRQGPVANVPHDLFVGLQVGGSGMEVLDPNTGQPRGGANLQRASKSTLRPTWQGTFSLRAGEQQIPNGTKLAVMFLQGNAPTGKIDVDLTDHPERRRQGTVTVQLDPLPSPRFVFHVMRQPNGEFAMALSQAASAGTDGDLVLRELGTFTDPAFDGGLAGFGVLHGEIWSSQGMRSLAQSLWDRLPCAFRSFWQDGSGSMENVAKEPGFSVLVASEEWHIPWEIVALPARADEKPQLLGQRAAISRWQHGSALPQSITVTAVTVVATEIEDDAGDDEAEDLIEFAGRFGAQSTPVTASSTNTNGKKVGVTFADVDRLFREPNAQIIHIRTHGTPTRLQVTEDVWLEADEVRRRHGIFRQLAQPPFVFLNSCDTNDQRLTPEDVADNRRGWAAALHDLGAAAYVVAYWNVSLDSARLAAKRFYDAIENGQSLAAAIRDVRLSKLSEKTVLAYSVCGHPCAALLPAGGVAPPSPALVGA